MWMHFLFMLPMMVCLIWSIILFLDYLAERSKVRLRLLIFMVTATFLYMGHYVFFSKGTELIPLTDTFYGIANLAVYPLYLFYIAQLTDGNLKRRQYLILLPALLAGFTYGTLYSLMTTEESRLFITGYVYHNSVQGLQGKPLFLAWAHRVCEFFFVILVLVVLRGGYLHLRNFERRVSELFADTEGRTLRPIHVLLTLFVVTSFLSVVFSIIGRRYFYDVQWMLALPSLLFSTMLFCVGYVGNRPMFSYADLLYEQQLADQLRHEDEADISDEESQSKIQSLAKEIERLMREEHLYLKQDLRLNDISRRLGTNSKYVSLAINQVIGRPFADYVNEYRIQYARELRHQHPDMAVTEIAHRAGYSSMQSFYRNQKKWDNPKGN